MKLQTGLLYPDASRVWTTVAIALIGQLCLALYRYECPICVCLVAVDRNKPPLHRHDKLKDIGHVARDNDSFIG